MPIYDKTYGVMQGRVATLALCSLLFVGFTGTASASVRYQAATTDEPRTVREEAIPGRPFLYFNPDDAGIRPDQIRRLEGILHLLQDSPNTEVSLAGHADQREILAGNIGLAIGRANSVRDFLIENGIPALRIKVLATLPLRFAFQWDDPIRDPKYGIALFNAFGSSDKSMHIHRGGHGAIPAAEAESWDYFFQRHLKQTKSVTTG